MYRSVDISDKPSNHLGEFEEDNYIQRGDMPIEPMTVKQRA